MLFRSLFLLSLLIISTKIFSGTNVVYGDDNRVDVFESRNPLFVELSLSTAAMISNRDFIKSKNGLVSFKTKTLASRGICEDERFAHQPTVSNCSGFLVGPNLLVTAGHCMTAISCSTYKWVFDYKVEDANQSEISVPQESVYSCKRIIERKLEKSDEQGDEGDDYALIELDRNVEDRNPLKFRKKGSPQVKDPLVVIGHPSGLPSKISDGAKIRAVTSKYFIANLDTFQGNSGSAVFNSKTGVVEGILVRGEEDYVRDWRQGCKRVNVCKDNECRGEDVTLIGNIESLKK